MSTKQDKFYETLRQTQVNTFSDGLNMDLHPLTTPNTILTDCVNGTMITYNDNEFVLQNDRGNSKIKISDTEYVKLSEGFIPVGMKEHNGILYIVSHNPQTKQSEIGTYPSPVKDNAITFGYEGEDLNDDITYYSNDLLVSQYDSYELTKDSIDPLKVLDHYVLSDGNLYKMNLLENGEYMFDNPGSGILGYKYRPFQIDTVDVTYNSHSNIVDLYLKTISTDDYLFDKYNDYTFRYKISTFLIPSSTENEESQVGNERIENITWNFIYQLESVNNVKISFPTNWTYSENLNVVIDDVEYSKVKINIEIQVEKDSHIYTFDNLKQTIEIPISDIVTHKTWFSTFKYQLENNDLNIEAILDTKKYNKEIKGDITYSFKLTDLEEDIYTKEKFGKPTLYYEFDKNFKLTDKTISFKNDSVLSIDFDNQCNDWILKSGKIPKYYTYKQNNDSITFSVFQEDNSLIGTQTTCSSTTFENPIDAPILYNMNAILSAEKNKIYLCTLNFEYDNSENHVSEEANFIVVTYEKMLKKYTEVNRMDEVLLEDWFKEEWLPTQNCKDYIYCNDTQYKQNYIPINDIKSSTTEGELSNLAMNFFRTYNQLHKSKDEKEFPKIINQNLYTYTISENCPISCSYDIDGESIGKHQCCETTYALNCEWEDTAVSKRIYLSDIFENIPENEIGINNYVGRLDYEWTWGPLGLGGSYAKEIAYFGLKINGTNYRTDIGFLDNTNELKRSEAINTTVITNCKCSAQKEQKFLYNSSTQNDLNFSHSLNLTLRGRGIELNKYTLGNGIEMSGNTTKIGMIYENIDKYCLIEENNLNGMDLANWYLKHLYYYKKDEKLYYFVPKNVEIKSNNKTVTLRITPNINLNNIKNLQSSNNLRQYEKSIDLTAPTINEKYKNFLNKFKEYDWELYANEGYQDELHFDNGILWNGLEQKSGENLIIPSWGYDTKNKILYFKGSVNSENNQISGTCKTVQFNYAEKEIPTVEWSYTGEIFPTDWDNLESYNDYYSLYYYKSSSNESYNNN